MAQDGGVVDEQKKIEGGQSMKDMIITLTIVYLIFAHNVLAAGQNVPTKTIHDDRYSISLSVPVDWEVQKGAPPLIILLKSPDENMSDTFNENCNIIAVPEGPPVSLEDLFQRPQPGTGRLTDFSALGKNIVPGGGGRAIRSEHRHTMQGVRLHVLQYTFLSGFTERSRSGFVLSCTALDDSFLKWEPKFEQIFKSFRFVKGGKVP